MTMLDTLRSKVRRAVKITKLTSFAAAGTLAEALMASDDIEGLDKMMVETLRQTFPRAAAWVEEENRILDEQSSCRDCGYYGLGYMLDHDLWNEAVGDPNVVLCLPCVERLLGRPVEMTDFLDVASVNNPIRYVRGLPPVDHRVPREDRVPPVEE